ncbi:MAG TPA: hypothetical protein VF171_06495 [Trueperaceae bacterium]
MVTHALEFYRNQLLAIREAAAAIATIHQDIHNLGQHSDLIAQVA